MYQQIDRRINKSFEEVCQDIADKKSVEYVGAYELMKHDKMKKQCFTTGAQSPALADSSSSVFYSVMNPASWPLVQSPHHQQQFHDPRSSQEQSANA